MRIGIYLASSKNSGGVYQYSLAFLDALKKIPKNTYVVFDITHSLPKETSQLSSVKIVWPRKINLIDRLLFRSHLLRLINQEHLDLIIFPVVDPIALRIKTPFIAAIHDLQHRINPQFPEVSARGVWRFRESLYRRICQKAVKIIAESLTGKQAIQQFYQVPDSKLIVLPYLPTNYLNPHLSQVQTQTILTKHGLVGKSYAFYPAKFWPHKNHLRLLEALSLLHQSGIKLHLVFSGTSGSEFDTFPKVQEFAANHGLANFVHYLGYVDSRELAALYKGSLCLTMPTYFGPSNLPIIEAWTMGTPVVYSDIPGCRDQAGSAALLVNPDSPKSIAAALTKLYRSPSLRKQLIKSGRRRLTLWTQVDFQKSLKAHLFS